MLRLWMVALALAVSWPSPTLPQTAGPRMSAGSPELLEKRLFHIDGGRRLNMVCIGEGSPTVVFEQALGGTILDWQYVQDSVSSLTRACFYDRAGYGYSDASPQVRSPLNVSDDLHALLRRAGERGPIVLVGHSIGGRYAAYYRDRFPSDVAGLVLVDPGFPGQDDVSLNDEDRQVIDGLRRKALEGWSHCAEAARQRQLTLEDPRDCFAPRLPYYTPDEAAFVLPTLQRPERWMALASEYIHVDEDDVLEREWGSTPLVMLSRDTFVAARGQSEASQKAYETVWKRGHEALARRSTLGRAITVPNSHHYIQAVRPAAVVAEIRKVVLEVREPAAKPSVDGEVPAARP